jgi:ACS family tartrate transporter-like MFS transporter
MIAIPLSGLLGGPLGGWLLGFDGRLHLAGWQWLFLLEGIPSVLLGFVTLRHLTERPDDARWLTGEQRAWLIATLRRERDASSAPHGLPPLRALAHPLIWLAALPELLVTTAGYAYLFWGPLLIRETLHTSNVVTGLLTGGVAVLSAAGMLLVGASSDRRDERVLHAAACAGVVALGAVGAATFADPVLRIASVALMQIAVSSFLAPFWCLPTMLLSGSSAAVGIALVNAIGNVGGFVGPYAIGFLRARTGGDTGAFLSLGAMAFLAAIICASMRRLPVMRPRSMASPIMAEAA